MKSLSKVRNRLHVESLEDRVQPGNLLFSDFLAPENLWNRPSQTRSDSLLSDRGLLVMLEEATPARDLELLASPAPVNQESVFGETNIQVAAPAASAEQQLADLTTVVSSLAVTAAASPLPVVQAVAAPRAVAATATPNTVVAGARQIPLHVTRGVDLSQLAGTRDADIEWQAGLVGSGASRGVVSDADGNTYMTGYVVDPDNGDQDIFIVKLDAAGQGVEGYGLVFGTDGDDQGAAVAVDADGQAIVTGFITNPDTLEKNAVVAYISAVGDGFVSDPLTIFAQDGGNVEGTGIARDAAGASFISGIGPNGANTSILLAKVTADVAGIEWGGFYAPKGFDRSAYGVAIAGDRGTLACSGQYDNAGMIETQSLQLTFDATTAEPPALGGFRFLGAGVSLGVTMRGTKAYVTGRGTSGAGQPGMLISKFNNPLPNPLALDYGWIYLDNDVATDLTGTGTSTDAGNLQYISLTATNLSTGFKVGGVAKFVADGSMIGAGNQLTLGSANGDVTAAAIALTSAPERARIAGQAPDKGAVAHPFIASIQGFNP